MRYNVHQSRNKIVRYLGVLVAAALVAALGLPSAAQAQTPAAPTIMGTGDGTVGSDGTLTVMWGLRLVQIPFRISGCLNIQSLAPHGKKRRR